MRSSGWMLWFLSHLSLHTAEAIKCLTCNEFPGEYNAPCYEDPQNLTDFGNKKDGCIVYQLLGSGKVIYRDAVFKTLDPTSRCWFSQDYFRDIMSQFFNETGLAMCCLVEGCNDRIDPGFIMRYKDDVQNDQISDSPVFQYPPCKDSGRKNPSSAQLQSTATKFFRWHPILLCIPHLFLALLSF